MFERYTEKARRVIFFARYEASQFGSPYIETEHLLLGLLREDKQLANRFLHVLPQPVGHNRRGRFLDQLLVPSLDRALSFEQASDIAVLIGEYLNFDMARIFDQLLNHHRAIAEALQRLVRCNRELLGEICG